MNGFQNLGKPCRFLARVQECLRLDALREVERLAAEIPSTPSRSSWPNGARCQLLRSIQQLRLARQGIVTGLTLQPDIQ
jgi:hypothetical protein